MKINRQQVFDKCGGRCGYCGSQIEFKKFQVDHIKPKCHHVKYNRELGRSVQFDFTENNIENLMPSCRKCNHYKRSHTLETFRDSMKSLHERLAKIYILEVATNFGMAAVKPFDGTFYFERMHLTPSSPVLSEE